ncbi:hypothetical protein A0H81_01519 [Grifola frondosa]|uniref:Uncharacterized protein n=1 Tax=Grifola frondosa TaxID=5627 RepID=A0A1C7MSF6_GRIFR|nr:hypothetical protein A0H81_01519 [Grifola frondosa]
MFSNIVKSSCSRQSCLVLNLSRQLNLRGISLSLRKARQWRYTRRSHLSSDIPSDAWKIWALSGSSDASSRDDMTLPSHRL